LLFAYQAHNLKVIGSNPIPATTDTDTPVAKAAGVSRFRVFCRGDTTKVTAV
jgi:hypothetical protein